MFTHFIALWDVIRTENSKLKASPIFFWVFTPILIASTVANWFDLRLFLGTVAWMAAAYAFGTFILKQDFYIRKLKRML